MFLIADCGDVGPTSLYVFKFPRWWLKWSPKNNLYIHSNNTECYKHHAILMVCSKQNTERPHFNSYQTLYPFAVASPRGNGRSRPPTSVQTPPEICANPSRIVLYMGGPIYVYCNFTLLTSKEKLFGPIPHFFGLVTPLPICL